MAISAGKLPWFSEVQNLQDICKLLYLAYLFMG